MVMGISQFGTPLSLYQTKIGQKVVQDSTRLRVGHGLEKTIAAEFARYMGIDPKEIKRTRFVRHPKVKFAGSTPDRFWMDPELGLATVQLKSVEAFAGADFGPSGTDEVKAEHLVQVLWEMFTAQVKVGYLAVLIGFTDFRVYRFTWTDANKALLKKALEDARVWWNDHYVVGYAPAPSGHPADTEIVTDQVRCLDHVPGFGECPDDVHAIVKGDPEADRFSLAGWSLREVAASLEAAQKEMDRRKNLLRLLIGGHDGFNTPYGVITNKPNRNGVRSLHISWVKLPALPTYNAQKEAA